MGYGIPNEADAAYGVQARLFASHIDDLTAGIGGSGVRSGCGVSLTSGMGIAVAAGVLANGVAVAGSTLSLNAADGTNPRVDVVRAALADGTVSKVTGTPGTDPVEPAAGAGYVKLWSWYVPSGVSALTSAMGTDRRLAPVDLTPLYTGLPSTSFIYNSSGSQTGTRYNSWPDLMAALADARFGGPRNILFEQNETLPAGTYDLADVTLLGNGFGNLTGAGLQVFLADGFTLSNPILTTGGGLSVISLSASPIIAGHTFASLVLGSGCAAATFGGPLVDQNGGTAVVAAYGDSTYLAADVVGGSPVVLARGGASVAINQSAANSYWDTGTFTSSGAAATITVFYNDPGPALDPAASPVLGAGGSYVRVFRSAAQFQSYTPAVSADWTGADPTTIAQALDRIAAAMTPKP